MVCTSSGCDQNRIQCDFNRIYTNHNYINPNRSDKLGLATQYMVLQMYYAKNRIKKWGREAHDTILYALIGKKFGLWIHSSVILTAMLSKMDSMAILAHELLGGTYTTYMCGHCRRRCSALAVQQSWPITIQCDDLPMRCYKIGHNYSNNDNIF